VAEPSAPLFFVSSYPSPRFKGYRGSGNRAHRERESRPSSIGKPLFGTCASDPRLFSRWQATRSAQSRDAWFAWNKVQGGRELCRISLACEGAMMLSKHCDMYFPYLLPRFRRLASRGTSPS